MKRVFIVAVSVLLSLGMMCCSPKSTESVININITDGNLKEQPVLYFPDGEQIAVELSDSGTGSAAVRNAGNIYVRLGYKYTSRLVWLTPGSNVNISFDSGEFYKNIAVDGTNGNINTFLNSNVYKYALIDQCDLSEDKYIALSDSLLKANTALLDEQGFPAEFAAKEKQRLVYYTYQILPSFKYFHSRMAKAPDYVESDLYWKKMEELCRYDVQLLDLEEYRQFIAEAVSVLSKRDFSEHKGIERLCAFIDANVKDAAVAEFLVARRVSSYIKKNGLDNAGSYLEAFNRYVKDSTLVAQFQQLRTKMGKCSIGAVSPDFKCTDVDGKHYTLADFKGKYVYIDVWATWCGPCKKEAPYFAELERKFSGKDIYFIGVSCDKNREAWVNMIRGGKSAGVQLHLDPESAFMSDYEISGIPRFILLDKEGRIISAKATAPSDPQTEKTIAGLLAR